MLECGHPRSALRPRSGRCRACQKNSVNARWRAAHQEECRQRNRAYYYSDVERSRQKSRDANARNPERVLKNALLRQRRKKENALTEPILSVHLDLLYLAQDGKCRYCHKDLLHKQLDHRIPISRGGADAPFNLCYACPICNRRKGTRTEAEFLELVA